MLLHGWGSVTKEKKKKTKNFFVGKKPTNAFSGNYDEICMH